MSEVEGREQIQQGKRILRVYEGFGESSQMHHLALLSGRDTLQDQRDIISLFQQNGFSIAEGGVFNSHNPLEFGFSNAPLEKDREIARKAGIAMPQTYSPENVVSIQAPLVVKLPEANRGENKYILETPEQKARFIAWALLHHNLGRLNDQQNRDEIIHNVLSQVSEGDFTDSLIEGRGWLDDWVFEEYINSPGEYNTSFRVVADALGDVQYAQVARSDNKKGEELMPAPKIRASSPLEEVERPGVNYDILLTHPDSPFYITPKKFVSNVARGGKPLLLNGQAVTDETDRNILTDLNINPENPQPPTLLVEASKVIGKEYRPYYPHVGVDYMQRDENDNYVLLEVNAGPHLRPEALGLPENTSPEQCGLEMMRRLISKLPN